MKIKRFFAKIWIFIKCYMEFHEYEYQNYSYQMINKNLGITIVHTEVQECKHCGHQKW